MYTFSRQILNVLYVSGRSYVLELKRGQRDEVLPW